MAVELAYKAPTDSKLELLTTKQSKRDGWEYGETQTFKVESVSNVIRIIEELDRGQLENFAKFYTTMMDDDPEIAAICSSRIDRVISPYWKVKPASEEPLDYDAAKFCFDMLKGIPNFYQRLRSIAQGIILGYSAHEKTVEWKVDRFVVTDLDPVNARRFIYDPRNKWSLNIYDSGRKAGKEGYGVPLIKDKWVVHQSSERGGDPCLNGVIRTLAKYFLYRQWIARFWLHYDETFGQPYIHAKVDENTSKDEMNRVQVSMENFSYDHVTVAKGATEISVTDSSSTSTVDGFERHWNITTGVCTRYVLGTSDMNQAGAVGSLAAVKERTEATADPKRDNDMMNLASTIQDQLFLPALKWNTHLFGGRVPGVPTFELIYKSDQKPNEGNAQLPQPTQVQVPGNIGQQVNPRVQVQPVNQPQPQAQAQPSPGSEQPARFSREELRATDTENALQIRATEAVKAFRETGTFKEELFKKLMEDLKSAGVSDAKLSKVRAELQKITLDAIEKGKSPQEVVKAILGNKSITSAGVDESMTGYLEMAAKTHEDMAYSGARWDQAVELQERTGKKLYWQYHNMGDGNMRDEHKLPELDGAVFVVGNEETDALLPPNAFGCRCLATYSTSVPEGATLYETLPAKFANVHDPNFSW